MNPISSIGQILPGSFSKIASPSISPNESSGAQGLNFQSMMTNALAEVGQLQTTAESSVEQSLLGADITSAEVFSAMKKADLALKTMIQVRNKLVDAFNEIQQIRI